MPPNKKMRTEDKHLVWRNDEVQVSLEITRDFKEKKRIPGKGKRKKCGSIRERSVSNLPKQTESEERACSADFFTKEMIVSKIKQIRSKYQKALDAGRQNGRGRIEATFYDLCSKIWSFSFAGTSSFSAIQ